MRSLLANFIRQHTIELVSLSIALFSLVISMLGFLVSYFGYRRDRAKIKVKTSLGLFGYDADWKVLLEVINSGRRKVNIVSVGFRLNNGKNYVLMKPSFSRLPIELNEGESASYDFSLEDLKHGLSVEKAKIKFAWASDATGNLYKRKFNQGLIKN